MEDKIKKIIIKNDDILDNTSNVEEESQKVLKELVNNYIVLIKDEIVIIEKIELINYSKPKAIYEVLFCFELILKLFLLKYTSKDLVKIGNYNHSIDNIILELKDEGIGVDIDRVYTLLKKFKYINQQKISFNEYYHIKYNHKKGSGNLLFDYDLSDKEKEIIKEVIEWIKKHLEI